MKLLTLVPSPNNVKVRVALGYKGLEYEEIPQDPANRNTVLEMSRQALTPVLEDDGVRMFDSGAILRYLHANFPGPALFPEDYEAMKKVENWEAFARYGVRDSLGAMFGMALGRTEVTEEAVAAANAALMAHTESLERKLQKSDWLVGDSMTAADITLASILIYNVLTDHAVTQASFFGPTFTKLFALDPETRSATHAWVRRVVAYDAWLANG